MFSTLVSYYIRRMFRKVGVRHISERQAVPTYQGVKTVLHDDPYRHVEISAAMRYINGLEQPCRIDPFSCEEWKNRMDASNARG